MHPRSPARKHSPFLVVHSDVTRPLIAPSAPLLVANITSSLPGGPLSPWCNTHPSPSPHSYLVPLLPLLAAMISISNVDRPTQHTPVYHPIPSSWLQILILPQCPTKLYAKWTFLTVEPWAVFSLIGYVILDVLEFHWAFRTDCAPSTWAWIWISFTSHPTSDSQWAL